MGIKSAISDMIYAENIARQKREFLREVKAEEQEAYWEARKKRDELLRLAVAEGRFDLVKLDRAAVEMENMDETFMRDIRRRKEADKIGALRKKLDEMIDRYNRGETI